MNRKIELNFGVAARQSTRDTLMKQRLLSVHSTTFVEEEGVSVSGAISVILSFAMGNEWLRKGTTSYGPSDPEGYLGADGAAAEEDRGVGGGYSECV